MVQATIHNRPMVRMSSALIASFLASGALIATYLALVGLSIAYTALDKSAGASQVLRIESWFATLNSLNIADFRDSNFHQIAASYLGLGIFCAILSPFFFESRFRGNYAIKGAIFSGLPFIVSSLLIMPANGGGLFGIEYGAGPLPIIGSFVSWLTYGLVLGTVYGPFGSRLVTLPDIDGRDSIVLTVRDEPTAFGMLIGATAGFLGGLLLQAAAPSNPITILWEGAGWAVPFVLALFGAGVGGWLGSAVGLSNPIKGELKRSTVNSIEKPDTVAESLKLIDIFRGLDDDQREIVAAIGERIIIPEGTNLGYQGTPTEHFYAILEGNVEMSITSAQGILTLRVASTGESFPLACLVGTGKLVTNAQAMTDIKAIRFHCDDFYHLCLVRPDIGMQVYGAIAEVLVNRYAVTAERLTGTLAKTLERSEFWVNV